MKTMIETMAGIREIDRGDLGRALSELRNGAVKVWLVPETDDEVRDQKRKAKKAAEERRSHAAYANRPSKRVKDAFFKGVRALPVPEPLPTWRREDVLTEAGIKHK